MKIHQVGDEVVHADGRWDRQDEGKSFFFFAILLKYLNNTGINKDNTYKSEGDTNQN